MDVLSKSLQLPREKFLNFKMRPEHFAFNDFDFQIVLALRTPWYKVYGAQLQTMSQPCQILNGFDFQIALTPQKLIIPFVN